MPGSESESESESCFVLSTLARIEFKIERYFD